MTISFPRDLAKIVAKRWNYLIGGQYTAPPCPSEKLLRELLETVHIAAATPDEGRYPKFNVVAVPHGPNQRYIGDLWLFSSPRPLSISEVCRLAPVCDLKKSAIVAQWSGGGWKIVGLSDLGTQWNRARIGLSYQYRFPECLFINCDRPNRLKVYQGQFLVSELVDGKIGRHKGIEIPLVLGDPAHNGVNHLYRKIGWPQLENQRDYESFLYTAFWNIFAAAANCISELGHGGAIIIAPANILSPSRWLRIKYGQESDILQRRFVSFMQARNKVTDFEERVETREKDLMGALAKARLKFIECQEKLVDAIRFVAQLSGCDGAIVLSEDLRILGFGAEIRAEFKSGKKVREIEHDIRGKSKNLDVESFGLRHRSAIKFVSREPRYQVIAISQDGPISVVWSDKRNQKNINVRRTGRLVNMNMPWA